MRTDDSGEKRGATNGDQEEWMERKEENQLSIGLRKPAESFRKEQWLAWLLLVWLFLVICI